MDKQAIAIHILCSHRTETAILSVYWPHLSCTALGLGSTVFYVPIIQQLFWLGFHYVWNNMRHSGLTNMVFLWHEDVSESQDPCIVLEDCVEGRPISRVQSSGQQPLWAITRSTPIFLPYNPNWALWNRDRELAYHSVVMTIKEVNFLASFFFTWL